MQQRTAALVWVVVLFAAALALTVYGPDRLFPPPILKTLAIVLVAAVLIILFRRPRERPNRNSVKAVFAIRWPVLIAGVALAGLSIAWIIVFPESFPNASNAMQNLWLLSVGIGVLAGAALIVLGVLSRK